MHWKINLTQMIYLRMGKTTEANPHRVNLRSPLLRIHFYQNKQLQGIPVPYINLQLNPCLNTELDLSCNDNLSFQCTTPSMWLTNCTDPNTQLDHQLEKDVGFKVFQFITQWRSRSSLVTKLYSAQIQQLLHKKDKLGQILSLVTIWLNKLCSTLVQLVPPLTALKIILLYV